MHGDRSALHEQLIRQGDSRRIAGFQHVDLRRVPALDGTDDARAAGWQEQQLIARLERARFDAPCENTAMIESIDILNGKAQRLISNFSGVGNRIERFDNRKTRKPLHVVAAIGDIVAFARRDREDVLRLDADAAEKRPVFG